MKKRTNDFSLLFMMAVFASVWNPSYADDDGTQLTVVPGKCVALKRGTLCYQDVLVQWRATQVASYCLYPRGAVDALHCWEKVRSGRFQFEFVERDTVHYELRRQGQPGTLATAKVELRWVHKQRRDRSFGWRLF